MMPNNKNELIGYHAYKKNNKKVCVIIPAYNEQNNIKICIEAICQVFVDLDCQLEIIVVDDGSQDNTVQEVNSIIDIYPLKLIKLSRNFGKEHAMIAGLDNSDADAVIIMDADLQHPVEMLPIFIKKWLEGNDIVYAYRENRNDEGILKRIFAHFFYSMLNMGSEVPIQHGALDFRLLDRKVVKALCGLRERVRFMKGLYAWVGYKSIGIPCIPNQRYSGDTKFIFKNLLYLAWDGLISFSDFPLKAMVATGALISIISFLYAAYICIKTMIFGVDLPGWATLVVAISFFGGIQLLSLGIIGSYIKNIFIETKQRPNYIIEKEIQSRLLYWNKYTLKPYNFETKEYQSDIFSSC